MRHGNLKPTRHKVILALSPFLIALVSTFFRIGGGQSDLIPFSITFPLLGFAVLIINPLLIPFKFIFPAIGLWEPYTTAPNLAGYYIISFIYSAILYLLLSRFDKSNV